MDALRNFPTRTRTSQMSDAEFLQFLSSHSVAGGLGPGTASNMQGNLPQSTVTF